MVDTLYTKMRQDAKVKKAAKSNDRQVYERSIFPGIFDTTAQQAYMENTEAYEQLFLDAEKWVTSKRGPMTSACFVCRKEQCFFETTLFRTLLTLFFYLGIMYL